MGKGPSSRIGVAMAKLVRISSQLGGLYSRFQHGFFPFFNFFFKKDGLAVLFSDLSDFDE